MYEKYAECQCAVYSLEISDESYREIEKTIKYFVDNKRKYSYNFLGAIPSKVGISWTRKYRFTCSQFVSYLLQTSNAAKLPKHYSVMLPTDFLNIKGMKLVYSGKIGKCKIDVAPRSNSLCSDTQTV